MPVHGCDLHADGRRLIFDDRAARFLLPLIPLALIDEPPLDDGQELLRGASIIRIIRLPAPGQGDTTDMMEVIAPDSVEAPAAMLD
jgi:hypothetical protein